MRWVSYKVFFIKNKDAARHNHHEGKILLVSSKRIDYYCVASYM